MGKFSPCIDTGGRHAAVFVQWGAPKRPLHSCQVGWFLVFQPQEHLAYSKYNGSEDPKLRLCMACLCIILSLSWVSDNICYKQNISETKKSKGRNNHAGEGGFLQMFLKEWGWVA